MWGLLYKAILQEQIVSLLLLMSIDINIRPSLDGPDSPKLVPCAFPVRFLSSVAIGHLGAGQMCRFGFCTSGQMCRFGFCTSDQHLGTQCQQSSESEQNKHTDLA